MADMRKSSVDVLADLVDEVSHKLGKGVQVDMAQYEAQFPDQTDRLRELLPILKTLASVERQLAEEDEEDSDPPADVAGIDGPIRQIGEYRIFREVGRGGMGIVYEAEQISLDRRVALKVLPFAGALNQRQLQRFKNEARAAASLDHPNIVHVHSVGSDRGAHYYAMQYVDGQTLAQIIDGLSEVHDVTGRPPEISQLTRDPIPESPSSDVLMPGPGTPPAARPGSLRTPASSSAETWRRIHAATAAGTSTRTPEYFRSVAHLGVQAARALEYAHGMGVVHRDVKPSNLMVDAEGHLWITDFGLAMTQTDTNLTMTGDLLGTVRYMSPEQLAGKHGVLDHRTDVYSLGATLYELLTLEPAFVGDDRQRLMRQVAAEEPRQPRRLNKAVPVELETIVLKAMAKNPAERYETAQELADDLERFLDNKPVQARRPSWLQHGAKWLRRHPSLVVSALLLLAVAVIGLSVGVVIVTGEQAKTAAALEEKQRALSESEGNVRLAAEAIDRMLTRVSDDAAFHGDLEHAELIVADAIELLQKLLTRSDDPTLRYRAARAYNAAGRIRRLQGRYADSRDAYRQGAALLSVLAKEFPHLDRYREALAESYNGEGTALYFISRIQEADAVLNEAETVLRKARTIRQQLAAEAPHEPERHTALADVLGNLGQVYREMGRFDEAEQACRRVISVLERLPRECRVGPEGLSRSGAALGNLGLVLRDRGHLAEAKQWLEKAFWDNLLAHRRAPEKPEYREGLYNACWNFADLALRQGDHSLAAAQVEEMVRFFPDRLQAYPECIALLLRGAEHAAGDPSAAAQADQYRRRAGELLGQSARATDRPPLFANDLAWNLATWRDESLRDASRAVALAESAVAAMPEDSAYRNTLGVARYRAGNWKGAIEALDKSVALSSGGHPADWLFLGMAHWQLDEKEEAYQWYDKAVEWMDENKPKDEELRRFRREAAELLGLTEVLKQAKHSTAEQPGKVPEQPNTTDERKGGDDQKKQQDTGHSENQCNEPGTAKGRGN